MQFLKYIVLFFIFTTLLWANKLDKVSLQLQWKHQFQFAGFYIAKEKGFYKDVGLDVDIKEFYFNTDIIDDVHTGKATFGTNYPTVILEKSNGKDIVLLSAILQISPHVLVSLKSSGIKSIKDFKNKKMMIDDNAIFTTTINSMLKAHHISMDDIKKTKYTFNIDNLISGKVDISTAFVSNELYQLDKKGILYDIWDPKDYGFDFYDVILFTSTDEIENNPQRVANFRKVSLKGWKYAFDNIEETVDIIFEKYNTQNRTKEALIYEAKELKKLAYFNTKELGDIDKNKIQRIYDIYNLMGLIKNKIKFDKFIYKPINKSKSLIKNNILTAKEKQYLKNKKQITMCIDPDWMPYEKFDKKGNHIGLSRDYFDIFQKQINIPIKVIKTKNWSESLEFAKQRKCDILSLAMETPNRKQYMNFTKPYLSLPSVLATKNNVSFINDFKQLSNKRIGIVQGYAYVETLKIKYPNLNIIEVKNINDGLQKVANNQLFGFVGSIADIGYAFQKNFIGELKIAGKFDDKWELGVAVRNDDLIILDIFQKLVQNISNDDKQNIFNKYIAIKYEKGIDYTIVWRILIAVLLLWIFIIYRQFLLKKQNKNLEQLQVIIEDKSKELQESINTMSKYIIYSRTDLKGIITEASDAFSDISQYSNDELVGKPHNIIRDPDMPKSAFKDMWQTIQSGNIWSGEVKNRKKDGTSYWVKAEISPEYDKDGVILGYIAIRYDITAKKAFDRQHEQLIQAEKMASMGEMIGNIAHQWRQPLSVISTGASGIQIKKEYNILTDEFLNETCGKITQNAQYLSRTIDDFSNFIRKDRVKTLFKLEDTVKSSLNLIKGYIVEYDIDVILDLKKDIRIDGYESELSQCFINIFNNAKDALVSKRIEKKLIFISSTTKNNNVIIKIKDNAGGIQNDILPKIFEPYFTTKHQSQGTGLGLHMTYNLIVDGICGTIEASNLKYGYKEENLKGALFTIIIPIENKK